MSAVVGDESTRPTDESRIHRSACHLALPALRRNDDDCREIHCGGNLAVLLLRLFLTLCTPMTRRRAPGTPTGWYVLRALARCARVLTWSLPRSQLQFPGVSCAIPKTRTLSGKPPGTKAAFNPHSQRPRKRQRLPSCLLIENASARSADLRPGSRAPRRFRSRRAIDLVSK
jgi:hypothetical protein